MRHVKPVLILTCLVLALAAGVRAETGWQRLARALSPEARMNPDTGTEAKTEPQQTQPTAEPPSVPYEQPSEQAAAAAPAKPSTPDELMMQAMINGKQNPASGNPEDKSDMAGRINFGLESEEPASGGTPDLFKDPEFRRMLGENPRFIYDISEKPDPMLAPWVRRSAVYRELNSQALMLESANDVRGAAEVYGRIMDLKDPRFAPKIQNQLMRLALKKEAEEKKAQEAAKMAAQAEGKKPAEEMIELPDWVRDNTTGVIVSDTENLCLVGESLLRVGDPVPNYPDVHVASIAGQGVTYQLKQKSFDVPLNPEQ